MTRSHEAEETATVTLLSQTARLWALILISALTPVAASAAPFAAYVMDARTGQPIYTQNADTKLHPASLTKMMTLYLAFTAIERGQVRLDSKFTVSSNAAAEPPSKLGLRAGQQIELRYLLRAAAIKSANDAATTIGEGLAGSEAAFAQQMTQMARALGMNNSQFQNAHGLTQSGHYSTAHDMSTLGRRLFYDFPQYYNLFSRRSADAGIANVSSTNKRFLDAYEGADGIKTGYTRAAGFNLTASAQRGRKRLVATVFGGTSTAQRNQVMAQLLDSSFTRIPDRVRETRPSAPPQLARQIVRRAQVAPTPAATQAQPEALTLAASQRPERTAPSVAASPGQIDAAVRQAAQSSTPSNLRLSSSIRPQARPGSTQAAVATAMNAETDQPTAQTASLAQAVLKASNRPIPAPRSRAAEGNASTAAVASAPEAAAAPAAAQNSNSLSLAASVAPPPRSETVILAAMGEGDIPEAQAQEIVSRPSNSGRNWGISLGLYKSKAEADKLLVQVALQGSGTLDTAVSRVADTNRGFEANLVNLTRADAQVACSRLQSRQQGCTVIGP